MTPTESCFGEPMKHIAIFQRDFQVGGIQKALLNILQNLDYERYAVDLYYFDPKPFYPLPKRENLKLYCLEPWPYWTRFVPFDWLKDRRLNLCDTDYDVAIDFNSYSGECAAGALQVRAKKRVMWIHNDMSVKLREEPKYRILWRFFKSKFQYFDAFAAVSPGIIQGFRRETGLGRVPVTVVQNTIDTAEIFRRAEEPTGFKADESRYNLCSMGRLVHQKGFDLLLEEYRKAAEQRDDLHLTIIGDGPERQSLENQIRRLKLEGRVSMTGNLQNPFPVLRQMDGFALMSRYEGQGIVLWEAKSLGLELFMAKHLEAYNPGLTGSVDLAAAFLRAEKREKRRDDLSDYNDRVRRSLDELLES